MLDDGNDSREKNDAPLLYTGNGAKGDKAPDIPLCLGDAVFRRLSFPSRPSLMHHHDGLLAAIIAGVGREHDLVAVVEIVLELVVADWA